MEEYIKWATAVVIPLLGLIIKYRSDNQDPGAVRRMKRHAQLATELPEESKKHLEELLDVESGLYAERMKRRAQRKLKGGTLGAVILVALVFGGALFGLSAWAFIWPWAWIFVGVTGFFCVLFLVAGAMQLYEYPQDRDEPAAPHAPAVQEEQPQSAGSVSK
ncbi:hypothetical protein GCM10027417_24090 [Glutamicibacter endophyticus]